MEKFQFSEQTDTCNEKRLHVPRSLYVYVCVCVCVARPVNCENCIENRGRVTNKIPQFRCH